MNARERLDDLLPGTLADDWEIRLAIAHIEDEATAPLHAEIERLREEWALGQARGRADAARLREQAALGQAWARVEAAMPEGWRHAWSWGVTRRHFAAEGYYAYLDPDYGEDQPRAEATGPTPAAALIALAEQLEARRP